MYLVAAGILLIPVVLFFALVMPRYHVRSFHHTQHVTCTGGFQTRPYVVCLLWYGAL